MPLTTKTITIAVVIGTQTDPIQNEPCAVPSVRRPQVPHDDDDDDEEEDPEAPAEEDKEPNTQVLDFRCPAIHLQQEGQRWLADLGK